MNVDCDDRCLMCGCVSDEEAEGGGSVYPVFLIALFYLPLLTYTNKAIKLSSKLPFRLYRDRLCLTSVVSH